MTVLPWQRHPESLLTSGQERLCRVWRTSGTFGLLLVGDAWSREVLMKHLTLPGAPVLTASMSESDLIADRSATGAPTPSIFERATGAGMMIPSADLVDPAVATMIPCDRLLASAPDVESVPAVLLSRLPVVVGLGVRPTVRSRRLPEPDNAQIDAWVVGSLAANGLNDHRLEIGAVRCLTTLAADSASLSTTLARHIVEPRLAPMVEASAAPETADGAPPADAPASGNAAGELGRDEADVSRVPETHADHVAMPEWATVPTARRYAAKRSPGRRGALVRARRGRVRRVVDYDAALGLDVLQTLTAAGRSGQLDRDALRSSIRVRRGGRLTVIIVDRSDSMSGVRGRVAAATALGALGETIANRSMVAVIAARGAAAEVVVEPTRDLLDAHAVIAGLPAGGGTPLASAFLLAVGLLEDDPDIQARVLVLSDGGTNVRLEDEVTPESDSALAQSETALKLLVQRSEQVVVIPTANPGVRVRPDDLEWFTRAGAIVRGPGDREDRGN
ncbi:VWA domain-containing protein [Gordonia sp. PKS22-38]|uniref:VWA domain-containing protein n=1 Tax=Gordonia prachuapensis TaxID=3115651 RepID=A0ABU7MN36_9ACTN|nr:VWA domain-containing protein [Gordonia sp. PKS22-38]